MLESSGLDQPEPQPRFAKLAYVIAQSSHQEQQVPKPLLLNVNLRQAVIQRRLRYARLFDCIHQRSQKPAEAPIHFQMDLPTVDPSVDTMQTADESCAD